MQARNVSKENVFEPISGYPVLAFCLLLFAAAIGGFIQAGRLRQPDFAFVGIGCLLTFALLLSGFFIVEPNMGRVLVLFGRYFEAKAKGRTGDAIRRLLTLQARTARVLRKGAEIAFSPGFRWGTSLLPGQPILMEHLMDQTAITYPYTTVNEMSGETIKTILEDVADNLFNPDPYLQQGGDMVRVGGLQYSIDPAATMGARISEMRLNGTPIDRAKNYKVAGWAPVAEGAKGEPIWDVVSTYLRDRKVVAPVRLNQPMIKGVAGNPGIA